MRSRVLFVDDESNILSTIKRQFRNMDYELLLANSGEEGLHLLHRETVSVIVSDMKMPEMDGARFLELSRDIQPDAVKIVLSGHSEIDTVLDSINRGNIWRFVTKPWDKDDLKIAIDNAIELYQGRIREKTLLHDLQVKTEELDRLNHNLEKIVEERTWFIRERSKILNLLLEEPDLDLVLKQVCKTVAEVVKTDIFILIDSRVYTNVEEVPEITEFGSRESYTKAITKDELLLGRLVISGDYSGKEEILEEILSLVRLVLHYKSTLEATPQILKDIDSYLEDL